MMSYKKLLGIFLIIIGLILNPLTIKSTIISDIPFLKSKIIGIILFDLILIITGIYLLKGKRTGFLYELFKSDLIKNILLTISTFVIIILLMETFTYFLNSSNEDIIAVRSTNKTPAYKDECISGYAPISQTINDIMMLSNGSMVYNYTYTTDQHQRRVNPRKINNQHLILFGDSFTFGVGLKDSETFPYQLSRLSNYNILNYAHKGYGPNHMLAYLEEEDFGKDISNKEGSAIYVFIEHHVRRAYGDMSTYSTYPLYGMPYYSVDKNGELRRDGCFATQNPVKILVYKLMSKSNALKFFKINFPIKNRDSVYLTFRIIEKSKQVYESKFNGTFYVLMHPLDKQDILKPDEKEYLMDLLWQANIEVLQYPIEDNGSCRIHLDSHPNAEYNAVLAKILAQGLINGSIQIK